MPAVLTTEWWVYVIQSQVPRFNKKGSPLAGFYYVGATTDPKRRLRQHNGEIKGGGRYTAQHRPWLPAALYGPYGGKSEALKAEYALKHSKRGVKRTLWTPKDSGWCCGFGAADPWVTGTDADEVLTAAKPAEATKPYRSRRRRRRR
jgi:predicted GIY-YIG superfamily endonuclease